MLLEAQQETVQQEVDVFSALLMRPVVTAKPDPIEAQISRQELLEQNVELAKQVNELRQKVRDLEYRQEMEPPQLMYSRMREEMLRQQRRQQDSAYGYWESPYEARRDPGYCPVCNGMDPNCPVRRGYV